jgi:hypothetical protein
MLILLRREVYRVWQLLMVALVAALVVARVVDPLVLVARVHHR